jgi:hypothetical protein
MYLYIYTCVSLTFMALVSLLPLDVILVPWEQLSYFVLFKEYERSASGKFLGFTRRHSLA